MQKNRKVIKFKYDYKFGSVSKKVLIIMKHPVIFFINTVYHLFSKEFNIRRSHNMKNHNILVIHAHTENRGDEAAVKAMIAAIKEKNLMQIYVFLITDLRFILIWTM